MNYYNPYYTMIPYGNMLAQAPAKAGLFSNLLGGVRGINWGSIINNTQRTLGLVNQAIPVIKQVTPIAKNAKTMFRVMNEFKKVDEPTPKAKPAASRTQVNNNQNTKTQVTNSTINNDNVSTNTPSEVTISNYNEPTFFI